MQFLSEEQLKEMTGYKSRTWLRRCLKKQGIHYIIGKGGRVSVLASEFERVENDEIRTVEFL